MATGSAAVEFGLIAPVFLTMLLGVFQVGVWMQAYNAIRNAVAETGTQRGGGISDRQQAERRQIENTGLAVATTSPYLLDPEKIEIAVVDRPMQPFPGARELTLTLTYQMPTFLDFAGIAGPRALVFAFAVCDRRQSAGPFETDIVSRLTNPLRETITRRRIPR